MDISHPHVVGVFSNGRSVTFETDLTGDPTDATALDDLFRFASRFCDGQTEIRIRSRSRHARFADCYQNYDRTLVLLTEPTCVPRSDDELASLDARIGFALSYGGITGIDVKPSCS